MKKIILPILFVVGLFSVEANAQKKKAPEKIEIPEMPIDEDTKFVIYKEVIQQEGTKSVLYDKAIAWAEKFYKNPKDVLREKNKESAKIMARHRFYLFNYDAKTGAKSRAGVIEYTLTFLFKDGRYKYEITKINWKQNSYHGIAKWYVANQKEYNHQSAGYLVQINDEITKVIDSFRAGIGKKDKVEEEW